MKRTHWIPLTLSLLTLASAAHAAADTGPDAARWYGAAHLGQARLNHWPAQVDFGNGVRAEGGLTLGDGPAWGLQVGRERGPWRLELEAQQGRLDLEGIHLGTQQAAASGRVRYHALTLNGAYGQPLAERWTAYAGVGVGWGQVDLPQAGFGATGCRCMAPARQGGAVWQARIGVELKATEVDRPFVQLGTLRLPAATGTQANGPSVQYPSRQVLSLALGWRRTF